MKFEKFLLASLTAGLFAACSSDDPTPGPGGEDAMKGDGYVAVTINLPTTPAASRAANDDFNDGDPKEYQVNSGALLLFAGADEASAQFKAAYKLELKDGEDDADNDNITTSYLTAVKINKVEGAANIYGLVMLNYDDVIQDIFTDGKLNIYTQETGNQTEVFEGTFAELVGKTSTRKFYNDELNSFFMTNAPLSNVAGGTSGIPTKNDVSTLVLLNNSLKPTAEEAKKAPAGSFFVERAVAKATLSNTATSADLNGTKLTIEGGIQWRLDNTEPSSYIVRNIGEGEYLGYANPTRSRRFVGTAKLGTTDKQPEVGLYRTYWAIDPHYEGLNGETLTTSNEDAGFIAAGSTPLYCHENTFSTAAQDHMNTTRALVKVTYKLPGSDAPATFFTVNGVETELYTSAEDAESFSILYILTNDEIKAAVKEAIAEGTSLALTEDNYKEYIDITFERQETGYRTVTGIKFKTHADFETAPKWTAEQEAALCELTNSYYRIAEYMDGVNYYDLRFKHFAGNNHTDPNDLAPWNPSDPDITAPNTQSTEEAYPGANAEEKWLGRYGMVRNNWYDVNISAFKRLGEPALPSLDVSKDKTPDDEKETEQWIAFKVNILSWAVRKQNHEF